MSRELKYFASFSYSDKEWAVTRAITSIFWLATMWRVVLVYGRGNPFPEGVCRWFDCSALADGPLSWIALAVASLLAIAYVRGNSPLIITASMACMSVVILSIERSHGVQAREEFWSMILLGQTAAHARYRLGNETLRQTIPIQNIVMAYSIQMLTVAYMIAGITKLQTAGINWVLDSPNVQLQVVKLAAQIRIEFGIEWPSTYADGVGLFIDRYPNFFRMLFAIALLIELFAFVGMLSKKLSRLYGIMLLLLHAGIMLLMFIVIPTFIVCIVAYMTPVPQWIASRWLKNT